MKPCEFEAGQVFEHKYPFVRTTYTEFDNEGHYEVPSWKPGVESVMCPPDDCKAVCEGEGKQIITVVDVHKPGRFPTRVFYTRKFVTPDGVVFGKQNLRITTAQAFRQRVAGYAYSYEMATEAEQKELAAYRARP
jgi:hypothetical protein